MKKDALMDNLICIRIPPNSWYIHHENAGRELKPTPSSNDEGSNSYGAIIVADDDKKTYLGENRRKV